MRHPGAPAEPHAPVQAPAQPPSAAAPSPALGASHLPARPRRPWKAWWLELCSAAIIVVVVIICAGSFWTAPLLLGPLLAVPPALAGIGAATVRRPLGYGAVCLLAAVIVALTASGATHWLPVATIVAVICVTGVSVVGTAISAQKEQQIANVISVAEAAQRAVLRPLPTQLGPLELGVVYIAAAADAKVGGDLYDVTKTPYGIRLIIGDVRGKGWARSRSPPTSSGCTVRWRTRCIRWANSRAGSTRGWPAAGASTRSSSPRCSRRSTRTLAGCPSTPAATRRPS